MIEDNCIGLIFRDLGSDISLFIPLLSTSDTVMSDQTFLLMIHNNDSRSEWELILDQIALVYSNV